MKKFILPLLLLFSLVSTAQIHKTATFDFSHPLTLKPAVTPRDVSGGWEVITDKTFTDGNVQVSFDKIDAYAFGAELITSQDINTGVTRYYLDVTRATKMIVTATNQAIIESIKMSADSENDGMTHCDNGSFVSGSFYREWQSSDDQTKSVTFTCVSNGTDIKSFVVNYSMPADILSPSVLSITPESTVEEIQTVDLTFPVDVIDGNAEKIMITGGEAISEEMLVKIEGKTVTLSLENAIAKDGTYEIVIPAGRFKDSEGFYNKELKYTFNVYAARNTFNPIEITPAAGEVKSVPASISLVFDKNVKLVKTHFTLKKDSDPLGVVEAAINEANKKEVILTIEDGEVTEVGTYTIDIAEASIHNTFYGIEDEEMKVNDRWNSDLLLTYTVTGKDPEPDPDPDPEQKPQDDSEIMKQAKELLLLTGVGYPAENSQARQSLKALVEADPVTSDDDLTIAINNFYKSTEIQLPETDKYYNIVGVNNGDKVVYLEYSDKKVKVTADAAKAASFKATVNEDNTVVLSTVDGKYMHVLSSSDNYTTTSIDNVTSELSDVNNITLAKLNVSDADDKAQFGLLTMYGSLGKRKVTGTIDNVYALVDYTTASVASDKDIPAMFTDTYSSAFKFVEVDDPTIFYVTLTPEVTKTETTQILKFNAEYAVSLEDGSQATIVDKDENVIAATITKSAIADNTFVVSYEKLADGNYTMVIPEGTFKAEKDETVYIVKAMELPITVQKDLTSFQETISTFYVDGMQSGDIPVKDTDLNSLIIYVAKGQYSDFVADETKEVVLYNVTLMTYEVARGVFKKYNYSEYTDALKLELNTPITEGSIPTGNYLFYIAPATFGDGNFAKYLSGDPTIKKSDCNVNPLKRISYYVNNELADGIEEIESDGNPSAIYDLSGRRIQNISRPGIYIINGKKFIKK